MGRGGCLIKIRNKTRQDKIRQDKTRRHNKTTDHEDKTVIHDKMPNKKTRFTTKSRYKKRSRRQDNNVGDYLRLSASLRYSRGGGEGIDVEEGAEDRDEEGREKEIGEGKKPRRRARRVTRPKSTVTQGEAYGQPL